MDPLNALSTAVNINANTSSPAVQADIDDSFINEFINIIAGISTNNSASAAAEGLSGMNYGLESGPISLTDPSSAIRSAASIPSSLDLGNDFNLNVLMEMMSMLIAALPTTTVQASNSAAGTAVSLIV